MFEERVYLRVWGQYLWRRWSAGNRDTVSPLETYFLVPRMGSKSFFSRRGEGESDDEGGVRSATRIWSVAVAVVMVITVVTVSVTRDVIEIVIVLLIDGDREEWVDGPRLGALPGGKWKRKRK